MTKVEQQAGSCIGLCRSAMRLLWGKRKNKSAWPSRITLSTGSGAQTPTAFLVGSRAMGSVHQRNEDLLSKLSQARRHCHILVFLSLLLHTGALLLTSCVTYIKSLNLGFLFLHLEKKLESQMIS